MRDTLIFEVKHEAFAGDFRLLVINADPFARVFQIFISED